MNATEERVSLVEISITAELDDWEQEDYTMRWLEYQLALVLRDEKDSLMLEEEVIIKRLILVVYIAIRQMLCTEVMSSIFFVQDITL